jgi:hypothetical protein
VAGSAAHEAAEASNPAAIARTAARQVIPPYLMGYVSLAKRNRSIP